MVSALDPRIVQVGIQIGGNINYYEGLNIIAQGEKYGNANQNTCQVRIDNLTREHRDAILQETTKFITKQSAVPTEIIVNAGRQSYGVFNLFTGNVTLAQVTQPPDIGIILNALSNFAQGLQVSTVSLPAQASLKTISQTAANNIGTNLNFQATDKQISNYSFTGTPLKHVENIGQTGNVDSYVNNGVLVVKDQNAPLPNSVRELSQSTGMIGVPEVTELGIKVKYLLDNTDTLGGQINLTSQLNPTLNGSYVVYKLSFDIASRDTPFYWIAECRRL
jgi:baseplate hub protein gp41